MTRATPSDATANTAVAQQLIDDLFDDDGNTIGPRRFWIDAGLAVPTGDGVLQALATLTPEELAETLSNRAVIEQAKGMLMCAYGTDADAAQELLAWRAREAGVHISRLAAGLSAHLMHEGRLDNASLKPVCDEFLQVTVGEQ